MVKISAYNHVVLLPPKKRCVLIVSVVHVERMRVKFVYERHQVKVKATGARSKKIPIPAMYIFDRQ